MGRGPWWFRTVMGLLALGLVATLAAFAYGAGYSDGSVGTKDAPGWFYGGAFVGWHVVGFVIGLIVFLLVLRILFGIFFGFGHRHGPWGYRYYGPGPWSASPQDGSAGGPPADEAAPYGPFGPWRHGWRARTWDARQAYLEDWHRQAHGSVQGPQSPGGGAGGGSAQAGSTTDSTTPPSA